MDRLSAKPQILAIIGMMVECRDPQPLPSRQKPTTPSAPLKKQAMNLLNYPGYVEQGGVQDTRVFSRF